MVLSKPMGTGAAVVTTLLVGWGVTNEAKINLTIHDSSSGALVWSYDHTATGGVISSPQQLAKNLMKNIASKFPYKVSNAKGAGTRDERWETLNHRKMQNQALGTK